MHVLNFKIESQTLECASDLSKLVPGTSGNLIADFDFSSDWSNCVKVASFWAGPNEHATFLKGDRCLVPDEVCARKHIKLQVTGVKNGRKLVTNKLIIKQGG